MNQAACDWVARETGEWKTSDPQFATLAVDRLLAAGRELGVSDIHLQPTDAGLDLKFRQDGVLQPAGLFPASVAANLVARLKVLAELLTYRTDIPQEGRIRSPKSTGELRVSTFPTLYGERAVVRFFAEATEYRRIRDLGLPDDITGSLTSLLHETSGAILVTGPAGCGKTTTVYAALREIVAQADAPRCIVSMEDPIEVPVEGVAQSQVNPVVDLDLTSGLRSLLRQDPEVVMVGEIRDPSTAEAAFQASLTGHLLLSTFHAGGAAESISRLAEMGIASYLLRSGIRAILSQRLCRKLCGCSKSSDDAESRLGLPVSTARVAIGCDACRGTGYQGRLLLAELLLPGEEELGRAILSQPDANRLEALAIEAGMVTRWDRACLAVENGSTSAAEIRRVLGLGIPVRSE